MLCQLPRVKSLIALLLAVCATQSALAATDTAQGAGATFPAPIYSAWAEAYRRETGNDVRYLAVGSGVGIERIRSHQVDFGATDVPLSKSELQQAHLLQFPAVIGGVVPVINLPGIKSGALKLSRAVLSDIYLGKIRRWDAPAIAQLNPQIRLPKQNITVVHRSDVSGTTFLWSGYLSGAPSEWQSKFGAHPALTWPTGVGGVGNEGVASYVQRTRASLGYVEYAYATQHRLSYVEIDDDKGTFVLPERDSFEAATFSARWNTTESQYDAQSANKAAGWPITGASYILVRTDPDAPDRTRAVLDFFHWAFLHGKQIATSFDYVSLPEITVTNIESAWQEQIRDPDGNPIWRRR